MQDTGKFRTNMKDQYYTKPTVSVKCVSKIINSCPQIDKTYQWIEPSAGNGVFLNSLSPTTEKMGVDIDPKSKDILKGDFLTWVPTINRKRIVFGNPPFGRQGSLAKSFIKHSADFADIIAFILPRSFVKPSMSRAFPLNFHCIHSEELEKNAFTVNGEDHDVPCVFQIWEKRDTSRIIPEPVKEIGFQYVKHETPFNIAFKRAGGLAGKCYPSGNNYNPHYHYFLKLDEQYVPYIKNIIEAVNSHTFPSNTTGPRSLSKSEANEVLNSVLELLLITNTSS